MSAITATKLRTLLPANLSSTQIALAEHLASTVCVARVGKGPRSDANRNRILSSDCRICSEPLVGELTLRHEYHNTHDGHDQPARSPCGHTFHLLCLVEWAKMNLLARSTIACPSDRYEIILREDATQLRVRLNLPPPRRQPRGRSTSADILPFWRNVNPADPGRPLATFRLANVRLNDVLALARRDFEIGFIDWEVVGFFTLSQQDRQHYQSYSNYMVPVPNYPFDDLSVGSNTMSLSQRAFPTCVYIQTARYYVDNHTNIEQGDYILVPISSNRGYDFRRRLLTITGPLPYIQYRQSRVQAYLSDLDAEQQLLQQRHAQAVTGLSEQLEAADHAHARSQSQFRSRQTYLHPVLDVPVFLRHSVDVSSSTGYTASGGQKKPDSENNSIDLQPWRCVTQ